MNFLFYIFSTGAWLSAAMVIRSKNPVHSVFYLVLVFFNASALLFLLDMEFFGLLQLLVYVGALAILFLFVVMLLDIPVTEIVAHQRGSFGISTIFIIILFLLVFILMVGPLMGETLTKSLPLLPVLDSSSNNVQWVEWVSLAQSKENLAQLGFSLYLVYVDLLILASLLLLVAMIGAVILTLKKKLNSPSHDIFAQHHRDFQKVVYLTTR
jgi:NADH-quinone oxidoreductase subunit J